MVSSTKIGALRLPLRRHKGGDTSVSPVPPRRPHFSWVQIQQSHAFIKKPPIKDGFFINGELDGIRTHDPLIKSQMLYRLSYEPTSCYQQRGYVYKIKNA